MFTNAHQFQSGRCVGVEIALVQGRSGHRSSFFAHGLVELELDDETDKVADVLDLENVDEIGSVFLFVFVFCLLVFYVCRDVVLGSGVEIGSAAVRGRSQSLEFLAQPPPLSVQVGHGGAIEDGPPPLVHQIAEGDERHLHHRKPIKSK